MTRTSISISNQKKKRKARNSESSKEVANAWQSSLHLRKDSDDL
jgi:hypothetical protein